MIPRNEVTSGLTSNLDETPFNNKKPRKLHKQKYYIKLFKILKVSL
jgi:hypothetical protein